MHLTWTLGLDPITLSSLQRTDLGPITECDFITRMLFKNY